MYEYDESRQTSQAGLIQSMLRWSTTIHQGTDFSDSESWCVLRLSGVSGGQIFKLWHIGFMPELDASGCCTTNTMLQQGSGALWRVSPRRHAGIFLWQESRELHLHPQHLQNRCNSYLIMLGCKTNLISVLYRETAYYWLRLCSR